MLEEWNYKIPVFMFHEQVQQQQQQCLQSDTAEIEFGAKASGKHFKGFWQN